tara:strand:- start:525 stop:1451 length:927 start_codon:yes stop_codon:yes gene_type:complete
MENYLYFAEKLVETGIGTSPPEALLVPASSYLGADPLSTTQTNLYFSDISAAEERRTKITLTHATTADGGGYKNIVNAMAAICNSNNRSNGGFIVVADEEADTASITGAANKSIEYNPLMVSAGVTTVAIGTDRSRRNIAVSGTTYGAGAIGTGSIGAPQMSRWVENNSIVTQIRVDITGLACQGDAANDVIGLAAGGAAYIYKNVTTEGGIPYKMEISCVEVPGEGTATITTDIDLAWNSSATLAYDGAAGTAEFNTGGFATVGGAHTGIHAVANDYLYLVEGDDAATTGVYDAGKFIINIYGYPTL